jgi:predicted PurR-regulated permease PerM
MTASSRVDQVSIAVFWVGLAGLAYLVFRLLEPLLDPLGWAGVIAVTCYPLFERLERRWGAGRAAGLCTLAVTAIVIVPVLLVISAFVREALDAAADLQAGLTDGRFVWLERAWAAILQRVPGSRRADITAAAADAARRAALFLASELGSVARTTAGFVFDLVLALFAAFFFLRDSRAIVAVIRRLLPLEGEARERLLANTRDMVSVSVTSALLVAAVQGLLGGLAFAAVGIGAPVFWGVVMTFFCLLPFGAWVVWLPAAVMLAAGGAVTRALVLAGIGVGVISAVDNILRPMLYAGRTRMNGLLIFISLFGGLSLFGAIGLVLGPLVIATGVALLKTYTDSRLL